MAVKYIVTYSCELSQTMNDRLKSTYHRWGQGGGGGVVS